MEKIDIPNHYYKYWKDLIRPRGFEVDQDSLTPYYGKFHIRPLERGFGITLGNSIRRVLLKFHDGICDLCCEIQREFFMNSPVFQEWQKISQTSS